MYAAIVAHLFPIYALGCLLAICFNAGWKRELRLAFAYAALLIIFQLQFGGKAKEFGYQTFLWCASAQVFFVLFAHFSRVNASKLIIMAALAAVCLNIIAMTAFLLSHPIRQVYFVGINIIQTVQIGSLIALSPLWPFLIGLRRKLPQKETTPWQQRAAISGPP